MEPKILSAMAARRRFGEIMNRVALRGEKFTIERAGKPLACIVPIEASDAGADIFDVPFATFNEWNDPSNDAYDAL
jgi:prevent-host-death family protein